MSTNNIIIAHPQNREQADALIAFMHDIKIKFEISKVDNFNPAFVKNIKESKQQTLNGKVIKIKSDSLEDFLEDTKQAVKLAERHIKGEIELKTAEQLLDEL